MTTSRGIHFGKAKLMKNEKASTFATSIRQVIQKYNGRGFNVKIYSEMDNLKESEGTGWHRNKLQHHR